MKLRIDSIEEREHPEWEQVESAFERLNGREVIFLVLENAKGDYVKCLGSKIRLTVEYRQQQKPGFKHYVLGKGKDVSPLKVSWAVIPNGKEQVRVHADEILDMDDARLSFKSFFEQDTVPEAYKKRNVTKLHRNGRR